MSVIAVFKDKASAAAAVMSLVGRWRQRPPLPRTVSCCGFSVQGFAMVTMVVGVVNIGLGPGRPQMHPGDLSNLGAAYWLGAVSILVGLVTFLSPIRSSFMRIFSAVLNIIGACFSIVGIVLYSLDVLTVSFYDMCGDQMLSENCSLLAYMAECLLTGIDVTLIILMSLQLLVNITTSALLFSGYSMDIRRHFQTYHQEVKVFLIDPAV